MTISLSDMATAFVPTPRPDGINPLSEHDERDGGSGGQEGNIDVYVEVNDHNNNRDSNNSSNSASNGRNTDASGSSSRRRRRHSGNIRPSQARALSHGLSSNGNRPSRGFSNSTTTSAVDQASASLKGSCSGFDSDEEISTIMTGSISGRSNNSNSKDVSTKLFEADARRSTREWAETQLRQQTQAILDQDQDFHLNKLNWNDVPLVGRDDSIEDMIQNYQSMITTITITKEEEEEAKSFHKIVSIHGKSGTGKSKLAMKLKESVDVYGGDNISSASDCGSNGEGRFGGGFFCVGKFDVQHQQASPYRGFVTAMDEIVNQILNIQNVTTKIQILNNVSQAISDRDIPALLPIIPGLSKLFEKEPGQKQAQTISHQENEQSDAPHPAVISSTSDDDVVDTSKRKKRLQYLFRKFVHAVCCVDVVGGGDDSDYNPAANGCIPFVLMLDDMQWADQPSLDLVEALSMEDCRVTNISGLNKTPQQE